MRRIEEDEKIIYGIGCLLLLCFALSSINKDRKMMKLEKEDVEGTGHILQVVGSEATVLCDEDSFGMTYVLKFGPFDITYGGGQLETSDLTDVFRPGDKVQMTIDLDFVGVCPPEVRGCFGFPGGEQQLEGPTEIKVVDIGVIQEACSKEVIEEYARVDRLSENGGRLKRSGGHRPLFFEKRAVKFSEKEQMEEPLNFVIRNGQMVKFRAIVDGDGRDKVVSVEPLSPVHKTNGFIRELGPDSAIFSADVQVAKGIKEEKVKVTAQHGSFWFRGLGKTYWRRRRDVLNWCMERKEMLPMEIVRSTPLNEPPEFEALNVEFSASLFRRFENWPQKEAERKQREEQRRKEIAEMGGKLAKEGTELDFDDEDFESGAWGQG